jgi:hypothetical protein
MKMLEGSFARQHLALEKHMPGQRFTEARNRQYHPQVFLP